MTIDKIYTLKYTSFHGSEINHDNTYFFQSEEMRDKAYDIIKAHALKSEMGDTFKEDENVGLIKWNGSDWEYIYQKGSENLITDIEEHAYGCKITENGKHDFLF